MVVTDPTIDPITGLPVLNPQDVIQQIPLGVQAFPYEDMQATARPTRNPLYGDDILPVSAFVAGQHPSTGSAQTVETDAAHAMKVFVVNGGGGGGLTPLESGGQGWSFADQVNGGGQQLIVTGPGLFARSIFQGVTVAAACDAALITTPDCLLVRVWMAAPGWEVWEVNLAMMIGGGYASGQVSWSPSVPIQTVEELDDLSLYVQSNVDPLFLSVSYPAYPAHF